jgi:hypothetical protein
MSIIIGEFVDAILEADRRAPRKQRHTAHCIWTQMQSELSECKIAERTVREYVHDRKIALGLNVRETCVPQSYAWGTEAEIDWYEAYADLGERIKLQAFGMRSIASGAAFNCDDVESCHLWKDATAIACLQLGRAFIGIEKDERTFETGCRRIRRARPDGFALTSLYRE